MSENTVVVKRLISASRGEVFEAFTDAEIMSKWFFPEEDMSAEVTNDPVVGGDYTLKMHAKNGDTYTHVGEYKEIVHPEKLVFTWTSDFVQDTLVTITFSESGGATEVTISHELLPSVEMVDNHRGGWTGCLNRLGLLLDG
jgi:uncharacterized protein YndB with AHSA1/START domain